MAPSSAYQDFRVIIVGGGLAGLTLANALERAGIDYLLLEARDRMDPAVGASMGMLPNGARIMDQLGCFDDIVKLTYGIKFAGNHSESGKLIHPRTDTELGTRRTGFENVFLDRQLVLRILYKHVKDKSKILTGKRLARIDHVDNAVTVHCEDGTSYTGDIAAGADGVYSKVRQQMWNIADLEEPGYFSLKEKQHMTAEYQILYGISTATPGLTKGNYDITYMKDVSSMVIIGAEDMVYWFLFKRLDRVYKFDEIPKYTKADAQAFAESLSDLNIDSDPKVRFGDIWKNRKYFSLHATEEADYEHWTWGRIACLGDAVHKTTPNAGIGGNAAFESAAALANSIKSLLDSSTTKPSVEAVKQCLKRYERSRYQRVTESLKVSNGVTRIQALKGFKDSFTAFYIFPNAGDLLTDLMADLSIGATQIDYLPPSKRSLKATMPFNPEQGLAKKESINYRILISLPLVTIAVAALAVFYMESDGGLNQFETVISAGHTTWGNGNSFNFPDKFYHIEWIDSRIYPLAVMFSSSSFGIDPVAWWHMLSFITDLGVLYAIILIESTRRSNTLTLAQLPFIFLLTSQFHGICVVAPLYFAFHYMSAQIANFKATDMRLTNLAYTLTVLPVMIITFYIPHYVSYLAPDLTTRHYAAWIWQLCPLWISILQFVLAKTIVPDTIRQDRLDAPTRDLPVIRYTVGTCIALAGAVWIYVLVMSPFSLATIFTPGLSENSTTWTTYVRTVLQYDHLFCWGSALLWLGYLFADMKHAGMVTQNWVQLVAVTGLSLFAFGPGATVGLGWLWREDILINKRHKGAVVKDWEANKGVAMMGKPTRG